MASITVTCEGESQKYPLDNPSVTLGRGLESDIRLKDIKASRRHCQIVKTPQGYQCVDLSSGNGTFLNGVQIKQQMLHPGDKIQIGTTTIAFEEASAAKAPAPAKTKSATGPVPKAASPAAAAKTGQNRVATAQIPVAQTRRITARVDAVKPGTQSLPKASASGAMKKTTQRTGATTRTAQVSATQKFKAEARKKKANPVALLLGGIGALFLVVVVMILIWPKDNSEQIRHQLETYMKKAVEFENQDKYDQAIAEFKKALDLCVGDRYKAQGAEIRARIRQVEENKSLLSGAQQKWADFKARAEKAGDAEADALLLEGKRMKADYAAANVPWLQDLSKQVEILQKVVDTAAAMKKREGFQFRRQEITKKHDLTVRDKAQYSAALKEWKEFMAGSAASDEKTKAQGEINTINVRAKEALASLRTRCNNLKESGKKDEAVEMARKERERFAETEVAKDLEELIQSLER